MNLYFDTVRDLVAKAHTIAGATGEGHQVSLSFKRVGEPFAPSFMVLTAAEARAMSAELVSAADAAERCDALVAGQNEEVAT